MLAEGDQDGLPGGGAVGEAGRSGSRPYRPTTRGGIRRQIPFEVQPELKRNSPGTPRLKTRSEPCEALAAALGVLEGPKLEWSDQMPPLLMVTSKVS